MYGSDLSEPYFFLQKLEEILYVVLKFIFRHKR